MMFWNSGWAWWQASLMWLAMIAFWGLLIWLTAASWTSGWLAVRSTSRNTSGSVT